MKRGGKKTLSSHLSLSLDKFLSLLKFGYRDGIESLYENPKTINSHLSFFLIFKILISHFLPLLLLENLHVLPS